jgi:hypothetical protein
MSKITIVTGLWDIGRDKLSNDWSRSFNHYLEKFKQLLSIDENMIIFGDENLQRFVMENRDPNKTQFIIRNLDWFKNNEYFDKIQQIRNSEEWLSQVGWLRDSTQARLEYYNPLVMSKVFLLNDARIMDVFDSEYMFWLDAGITNTVHQGYFTHDKVLSKLDKYVSNFSFVSFPYEGTNEVHGFNVKELNDYAGGEVKLVSRGGFFGGPKNFIGEINEIYYHLLIDTLSKSLMGTEESLFSIMTYKHSDKISYFEIDYNGLLGKFFENLKNDLLVSKKESVKISPKENSVSDSHVSIYVIGFNSPNQFKTLIKSMLQYDEEFITKPRKILLDNSTDLSTTPEYSKICSEYGFEHIKKDNLGICGGRQWIAEHFENSEMKYMYFFEDDMFFYPKKGEVCRNGFNRFVKNIYQKSLSIINTENLDFLKLNFSEFYGDNSTQWSWYNVPQNVRDEVWPNNKKLPVQGLDPNAPRTRFESIKYFDGIPYALGEVYYCNWPQVVSKEGNRKMFLNTKWNRPFEQTWMSYMFQETIKGNIKSGLLLLTPTEHDRFDHYDGSLRKES